jgi:hypothetical protein
MCWVITCRHLDKNIGKLQWESYVIRRPDPQAKTFFLTAYCDLNWASCPTTRRSVSDYLMKLVSIFQWSRISFHGTCHQRDHLVTQSSFFIIGTPWLLPLSFIVTIKLLYTLSPIPFFMNVQSILRLIVILFENI